MSQDKKKSMAATHEKWEKESEKIRKVQISLDFPDAADIMLRTLAAREHKAPSSMIREILGMPSSPPKRARIGVSFNDQELRELGKRYRIDPNNKAEIRRRLTEEVTSVLSQTDEGSIQIDESPATVSSEVAAPKSKKALLDKETMRDLQTVSDDIHQRFQNALAMRKNKDESKN